MNLEKEHLFQNGDRFSFFQAARLLSRLMGLSRVRFQPGLSFDYPEKELAGIRETREGASVITTFMGLYGVSSPLPAFYTQELIDAEKEEQTAARALLDILHQRLYLLFYDSLRKYMPLYPVVEDQSRVYTNILFALMGMRDARIRKPLPVTNRLLRYIGLFTQQPRSALGLKTLLEDAFEGYPVEIIQCAKRVVEIPEDQKTALGRQAAGLGKDAVVGSHVPDRMGKIIIRTGPLTHRQFHLLLNDAWVPFVFLIQFYLSSPMECEVELILEKGEAKTVSLGRPEWASLGRSAWLISGRKTGEVRAKIRLNRIRRKIVSYMQDSMVFQSIDRQTLEEIAKTLPKQVFAKGEYLVKRNETKKAAYIITKGKFVLFMDDALTHALGRLTPGSVFGEDALIRDAKRHVNIVAQTDSEVVVLTKDTIDSLMQTEEKSIRQVLDTVKKRVVSFSFS